MITVDIKTKRSLNHALTMVIALLAKTLSSLVIEKNLKTRQRRSESCLLGSVTSYTLARKVGMIVK